MYMVHGELFSCHQDRLVQFTSYPTYVRFVVTFSSLGCFNLTNMSVKEKLVLVVGLLIRSFKIGLLLRAQMINFNLPNMCSNQLSSRSTNLRTLFFLLGGMSQS